MDADRGTVYLLETAKDWLARDFPGYRVSDVDSFLGGVLAELRGGAPPSPAAVRAVTFPLTKWRTGYAPRDVDRLVGELAQLVQRPGSDVDIPLAVRELVDRIRNSRFGATRRGGYEEEEVDEFLDRIMRSLIRGERGTMRQLAGEAQFTTVRLRPAYVMADVDDLLGSVERALSDLAWLGHGCACRKCHPCRLSGVPVLVEDAAEAVASADVKVGGGGQFRDRAGNALSGRALAIPSCGR